MSYDIKLGNDFLRVPKLPADRKGFIIWKERLELSICARGLYGHLDGTITRPADPSASSTGSTKPVDPKETTAPAAASAREKVSSNEEYMKNLNLTGAGHSVPANHFNNSQFPLLEDKG